MTDINLRQLLQAGVHFGHQCRYWSPDMAPYIYGDRNKIHIMDLEKTLSLFKEAMNYLGSMIAENKKVLFVGTKRQAGRLVREQAKRCGCPYVDHRWLGGMLTNYKTVKNSISRLKELEERISSGDVDRLSKKEGLSLERERIKLDKTLSGIKNMNGLPDVLFVIDVEHEYIAVAEASKLGIPVIAVVDSNCSSKGINYIIPGNDDSTKAIKLYLETAADTVLATRAATSPVIQYQGDEDYVEVDAAGRIIANSPVKSVDGIGTTLAVTEAVTETASENHPENIVTKKKVKKKVVVKRAVNDETTKEVTVSGEVEGAGETIKEKVAKKKVVKKKTMKATANE